MATAEWRAAVEKAMGRVEAAATAVAVEVVAATDVDEWAVVAMAKVVTAA